MRTSRGLAPTIVDLAALREAVTLPDAVTAVEEAFRALARRTVVQPPPVGLDLPGGEVHVKSGQLGPDQPVVVKVATGFPGDTVCGLPPGDGVMLFLDPGTGRLRTVLLDRGWLTGVRTAAVTTVAVRHLASSRPQRRLAILGTGAQSDLTLSTLGGVALLHAETTLWGRDVASAQRLADRHAGAENRMTATSSAEEADADGADVVITVTAARTPVLAGSWLADDALVIAVGADSPGKPECDSEVLTRAAQIVVDSSRQARRLGELQHLPAERLDAPVVDLADLVARTALLPRAGGIRLCDLTGVGAADAAVAALAERRVYAPARRHRV